MAKSALALVLHAHLPYVRSSEADSLEEDWFFQALVECYLPLLEVLERARADPAQSLAVTIGLSPTLLSLLSNPELQGRFPVWLRRRRDLLDSPAIPAVYRSAANHLAECFDHRLRTWMRSGGDLISRFSALQRCSTVDLLTCGATHGYLPLLREYPEVVRAQLRTAVREHQRLIGEAPLGIWLPECAYYEGLDHLMRDAGLRYAVLDAHGLLHGYPRPRYGVHAPICSRAGVAFFGRNIDATLPIWSAQHGYPGDPCYREFHKDFGRSLAVGDLERLGFNHSKPLGIKLHRVGDLAGKLDHKEPYDPAAAMNRVSEHARHYLQGRRQQFDCLDNVVTMVDPLLVVPFDAELFGHWWFEGPEFLAEILRLGVTQGFSFTSLRQVLASEPSLQLCEPCPSSWGQGGYHSYWLDRSNSWVIPEWSKAGEAMVNRCSCGVSTRKDLFLLRQAARELLLAQSSDWSFILQAGTTTELACERINLHLSRFWRLMQVIDRVSPLDEDWLQNMCNEDQLFPLVQPADWRRLGS